MEKMSKGFTIIEIIIVISLLITILIGLTQLNFRFMTQQQKLDIFTNKIINNFEEIRNNALFGKGILIGNSIEKPEKRKIEFAFTNSGSIKTYYKIEDRIQYNEIPFEKHITMKNFICLNQDETKYTDNITDTGIVEIQGKLLTLDSSCNNNEQKLHITILGNNNLESKIKINTLNGIIESSK